jgi:hypothetical protein
LKTLSRFDRTNMGMLFVSGGYKEQLLSACHPQMNLAWCQRLKRSTNTSGSLFQPSRRSGSD